MAPGSSPDAILEALFQVAVLTGPGTSDGLALSEPPPGEDPGARLARHAHGLLRRGAAPLAVLDSALVAALYRGEREALRGDREGRGEEPLDSESLAAAWEDYPRRMRERGGPGAAPANPRRNLQLMITRRCQLRCAYCPVVKADRDMPAEVVDRSVDLLVTARAPRVRLDLTGGEALLRADLVRRAVDRLSTSAQRAGKQTDLYMVSNGFQIDRPTARWLADTGFEIELSLDGPEAVHNRWKLPLEEGVNPYRGTREAIERVLAEGGRHRVVMVATPETVDELPASFAHVARLGVRKIDVNYAIGRRWLGAPLRAYLAALHEIVVEHGSALREGSLRLGNLGSRNEPSVLNGEWMVDVDGSIHLMTEWALESSRPAGAPVPPWGHVSQTRRWDDLHAGRFHAYLTLLRTYAWRDPTLRATLLDNVITGREVARGLPSMGRGEP